MNKINILRTTADKVEAGELKYNWYSSNTCNCGVLATVALGGGSPLSNGLYIVASTGKGVFSGAAHCMTTGLPLPKVFQVLKDAGFTYEELNELEYLSNKTICQRAGIERVNNDINSVNGYKGVGFNDKSKLIKYLRAWADILEEEQKPKVVVRYVPVIVPEAITKMDIINN